MNRFKVIKTEAEYRAALAQFEKFVQTLVALSVTEDGPRQAREYLNKAGILVLALPHLAHTYLDGSVFFAESRRPVIALTLRYDRLDNFWFVLLHELGHLKLGHLSAEQSWIVDDLELPASDSRQEADADSFASSMLLPSDFSLGSKAKITAAELLRYARDHGISPAIVAGRIQHAKNDYRSFSNLLGRDEVRKHFPQAGAVWGN
jgi:Domain of unknown function (DUF955).